MNHIQQLQNCWIFRTTLINDSLVWICQTKKGKQRNDTKATYGGKINMAAKKVHKGYKFAVVLVILCILLMPALTAGADEAIPEEASAPVTMGYESKLFDSSYVHTIDIEMAEEDLEDLWENALDKTKYDVSITIDGEILEHVSFAAKGNSSLSSVYSSGSKRFSFKINFGKNIKGQRYYGLHKLNLSNMYLDATYMKDYLAYRIFEAAGVPAPLTSYCFLSINGEPAGLYLAIEDIGDSFRERVLMDRGELYKPDSESNDLIGGGVFRNGGSSAAGDGTDLVYIDDEIESYTAIFDNAETSVNESDMLRVIEALRLLSDGKVEDCLDTEEIIRYFAAHNYLVNYDSMTGSRTHNYYLYENEGKLALLPWDYNESIGAHGQPGAASDVVNSAIDTPLKGTTEEKRPVWNWIVSDEQYTEAYHEALQELLDTYFYSGECADDLAEAYELIRSYVETDPTAFYTVEQFDEAYENLQRFVELRTESIQKQLDGTLASVTSEQKMEDLVDTSSVSITAMGGRNMGGGGQGGNPGGGQGGSDGGGR